jgi:hypothetical protein
MSGWIKIHRSITDHWLYTEKRVYSRFEAWNDILLTVNYSDAKTIIKGKMYIIKRGESILSLESWSKRWNWDKSKVRRFLSLLQNDAMIVVKGDSITTHLIVCKYDSYQGDRHADETQPKRKRNADDIQTTPIKEEEEYKKNKKKKNIEERKLEFSHTLKPFLDTYGKDLLNGFYKYWTEPNKSNTKFKQELEKTWSIERRLETWANNERNYNKPENIQPQSIAHTREFKL